MPASSPFAGGYGGTSITQRGNRRQMTFFRESDYRAYLDLLVEWCGRHEVRIWAEHFRKRDKRDFAAAMRRRRDYGPPLGGESFVAKLESLLGRVVLPGKPGWPKY